MKRSIRLSLLIPLSLAAFAMLFLLLGIHLGRIGSVAVLVVAWVVWYLLWKALRERSAQSGDGDGDGDGIAMSSPGEWRAWIGLLFSAAILLYLATHIAQMVAADGSMSRAAPPIARHIVMLIIIWLIAMQLLRKYWRDTVHSDERDRAIQALATRWARGALIVFVIALAAMLGLSPLDRLLWAQPIRLSNILIAGVIGSCTLEYLVSGLSYWRDRRSLSG